MKKERSVQINAWRFMVTEAAACALFLYIFFFSNLEQWISGLIFSQVFCLHL